MGIFNGFKFREKAISLYKQGKDINQIQREVSIVLELETVQKWVEEDKKYDQTKEYIKQSIKIKKQIKKLKNNEEELEKLYNDLKEVVSKILEINPENEIAKYRRYIEIDKYAKEKAKREQSIKEQKEYSKKIIERLKNGEISKEEIPQITGKLREFPDKVRSTFLISKLYEILFDKKEALLQLANYANINKLNQQEKDLLIQMQEMLTSKRNPKLNTTTLRIRKMYETKENQEKVYKKKIQKDTITNHILDGKTVLEIFEIMKENGTSIKTISKIRKNIIDKNEALRTENIKLEGIVGKLLQAGFSSNQVHKLVEYDVSMTKIEEIREGIESKKENDTENIK